ncbi:MAG TPA: putative phage abortive infection protein [Bacteroidia bacterium]|jgi:hypothetical protein|nr:putative phage abortive infection protein [Bacteroidia bacterium]
MQKNWFYRNWAILTVVICCILSGVSIYLYCSKFRKDELSDSTSDWGTFGDYIGGVLGTILSFFSVILIYATYKNQVVFSSLQQFETTFFNLLQNQREILKSLGGHVYTNDIERYSMELVSKTTADDYISAVSAELNNRFDNNKSTYIANRKEVKNISDDKNENQSIIDNLYGQVYKGKEGDLGHYFRHLYHIVKYTHESENIDKKKYIDIIQAQMSDDELYLTFYNGISKYGKTKFLPLLEEYQFLENVRKRGPIFEIHCLQFYPKTKFKFFSDTTV